MIYFYKTHILLIIFKKCYLIKYHCEAATLAIHLVLWLCTRLEKWHQLLIALSRDLKYFDDVELVFPLDKF